MSKAFVATAKKIETYLTIFPECVARVPVSLWGSGGWGCVRLTLRLSSQPFATVRNRLQSSATVCNRPQPSVWGPYGRAYGKFCRRGAFWRFQTSCCFISRGRCGTSWHSDLFCNVSKVVLCGRSNTFATFSQKMRCSFRGRRSTLDVSIIILRGRCSALDVSCGVFFYPSHWQGCVRCRQGANSVARVAFCEMW